MGEKLTTGIDTIDRRMAGGLRPGSLLAIVAGPTMQSEALLHELIEMRPTLYLSTVRRSGAVEDDLSELATDDVLVKYTNESGTMDNELLQQITGTRTFTSSLHDGERQLDTVYELVGGIDHQANVILDPVNPLEETDDKRSYRAVLNELKKAMLETDGVGILHCITTDDPPPFRDVTLTIADVVWELDLVSQSNEWEYQLTIPKNRGGQPMLEETSIVIDSEVWIDESRNI